MWINYVRIIDDFNCFFKFFFFVIDCIDSVVNFNFVINFFM